MQSQQKMAHPKLIVIISTITPETATEMRVDSSLLSADASTCFRRVESLAIGRVEILVDAE